MHISGETSSQLCDFTLLQQTWGDSLFEVFGFTGLWLFLGCSQPRGLSASVCLCLHLCQDRTVLRRVRRWNKKHRDTQSEQRKRQVEHGNRRKGEWGLGLLEIWMKAIQFLQFSAQTTKYTCLCNHLIGHRDSFAKAGQDLLEKKFRWVGINPQTSSFKLTAKHLST